MHTSHTWCMHSLLLYLTNHSHNQLQYLNQTSGGKTSNWKLACDWSTIFNANGTTLKIQNQNPADPAQ